MMHMLTRILLAMYLAIWSPAVCCCGVKAAMGAVTGIEIARCGEAQASSAEANVEPTASDGCCSHGALNQEIIPSCHGVDAASSRHEPSPCRCHERVETKVRIDTGAKVSVPALVKIDTLPAILPVATRVTMTPSVAEGAADNRHRGGLPVRRNTLLDQRCLLLT